MHMALAPSWRSVVVQTTAITQVPLEMMKQLHPKHADHTVCTSLSTIDHGALMISGAPGSCTRGDYARLGWQPYGHMGELMRTVRALFPRGYPIW